MLFIDLEKTCHRVLKGSYMVGSKEERSHLIYINVFKRCESLVTNGRGHRQISHNNGFTLGISIEIQLTVILIMMFCGACYMQMRLS